MVVDNQTRLGAWAILNRQLAGEEIRISGKVIHFPKRQLEKFTYNFEDSFAGLYTGIANQIDQLTLPAYNIKSCMYIIVEKFTFSV